MCTYRVVVELLLLHELARECGITVPASRLIKVGNGYHTFMVQRFDRDGASRRFFASAMTMTGHQDTEDASYLELAEFLATWGEPDYIARDLEELFTRVVFNIVTANRDDHLRNHGFMRTPAGWRLAPAYDMNPSFKKDEHALAIDLYTRQPDMTVVMETAEYYRLEKGQAKEIVSRVSKVVGRWKACARRLGLSAHEISEAEHLFLEMT